MAETAQAVVRLTAGQLGRVYRVDTPRRSLVVKFLDASNEPTFADDVPDNRVIMAQKPQAGGALGERARGGGRPKFLADVGKFRQAR
jgi:hypothetical protein